MSICIRIIDSILIKKSRVYIPSCYTLLNLVCDYMCVYVVYISYYIYDIYTYVYDIVW